MVLPYDAPIQRVLAIGNTMVGIAADMVYAFLHPDDMDVISLIRTGWMPFTVYGQLHLRQSTENMEAMLACFERNALIPRTWLRDIPKIVAEEPGFLHLLAPEWWVERIQPPRADGPGALALRVIEEDSA